MITQSPFRIADVTHLADQPDDPELVRLIATFETSSDYGIAGRDFEITGTTDVLVATYRGAPTPTEMDTALAGVINRPDDTLLRLRYRYLGARCLKGDDLSPGEREDVAAVYRRTHPGDRFDLLIGVQGSGTDPVYPARWAPNGYAAALLRALGQTPAVRD